jgi:hypothetical protein
MRDDRGDRHLGGRRRAGAGGGVRTVAPHAVGSDRRPCRPGRVAVLEVPGIQFAPSNGLQALAVAAVVTCAVAVAIALVLLPRSRRAYA